jgi:CHASE2 domain-containing sensor protein
VGKLVVLKIGEGSFQDGFPITLEMGDEGAFPSVGVVGKLPPAPDILQAYRAWQQQYYSLDRHYRLTAPDDQETNISFPEQCRHAALVLQTTFQAWLNTAAFRPIQDKWLEQLQPTDTVRVILQTQNLQLQRLPWHLWPVLNRYPKAEIALSAPEFQSAIAAAPTGQVKILAILGNSRGIDTQVDRQLLEELPHARVTFLVEPQRQTLTDDLWRQPYDILFFAGHSASQQGETGRIYVNAHDSLTISELKNALGRAVERGLKLAIFNSCDGLELAQELSYLKIPQVIFMREPVPDRIAQCFLKYFLEEYASGQSLYQSVRQARERLQGLEDQFPCATWLPVIFQNPAAYPPTWQSLLGQSEAQVTAPTPTDQTLLAGVSVSHPATLQSQSDALKSPQKQGRQWLKLWLSTVSISLAVAGGVIGGRSLGLFQSWELRAFDTLMQQRPPESADPRLVVVTLTEADLPLQPGANERRGSMSDLALSQALEKLSVYQPRVIGLDIYRDYPVKPSYPQLKTQLQQSDRLIGVCKMPDAAASDHGTAPPPELRPYPERLGFTDFALDADKVLRRHLLAMTPAEGSVCTTHYGFSTLLALRYLAAEGVTAQFNGDRWQLGRAQFKVLQTRTGGYQHLDAAGSQILLNYRAFRSPEDGAATLSLSQLLQGQVNPEQIRDRVVIIGTTADTFGDSSLTPYPAEHGSHLRIPGVLLQAQMVSQLLSAALEGRPLITAWPLWADLLWIVAWSGIGGGLGWYWRRWIGWGLTAVVAIASLYGLCWVFLVNWGWWVPLVPAALGLIVTGSSIVVFHRSRKLSFFPTQELHR